MRKGHVLSRTLCMRKIKYCLTTEWTWTSIDMNSIYRVLWCLKHAIKSSGVIFINANGTHWDSRRHTAAAHSENLLFGIPEGRMICQSQYSVTVTFGVGLRHLFLSDGKWQPLHWIIRWQHTLRMRGIQAYKTAPSIFLLRKYLQLIFLWKYLILHVY